jgi:hypothetical protein
VLFCDLVGSTEIAAQLDPEEWREVVAGYHRAAAEAVSRYGGHVAKYLGDGVMAYFGWPEAHDNDAERAARAGLAILDAISKLNEHPKRPKLAARVGIDSGAVVVGAGAGLMEPSTRRGESDCRSHAQADDSIRSTTMTAISCNRPSTVFSHCSACRSRTNSILSARSTPHCEVAGLYFTGQTLVATRKGEITDRLIRAVYQRGQRDKVGRPAAEIRLGGIYGLRRTAQDAHEDYKPIMEILTAFVTGFFNHF